MAKRKHNKAKAPVEATPQDAPLKEESTEKSLPLPATMENAKVWADAHLLPKDERFAWRLIGGEDKLFDRCSPTHVSEDGQVFHAEFEGECKAHCKDHGRKYFSVFYKEVEQPKENVIEADE